MRIDGFSSQSYPVKRAPRKAAVRDEAIDDAEVVEEAETAPQEATALASYLSTAGFNDWDMEVLGLDLYI